MTDRTYTTLRSCGRKVVWTACVVSLSLFAMAAFATRIAAEDYLTGAPFRAALNQPLGGAWTGVSLRQVLNELSRQRKVAILLDRRSDPTQELSLSPPNKALRDLIADVAASAGAGAATIGHVVYVGPKESAERLKTLVDLRGKELAKLASGGLWQTRFAKLKELRTLTWNDFDRPRELLQQIAARHQLNIENLEQVPHDLWAGNSLPQVTAVEALSLLLVQFGSTFEFVHDRAAIRIVPLPSVEVAVVEMTYPLPAVAAEKTVRTLRDKFPKAAIEQNGQNLIIRTSADQQLLIAEFMKHPQTSSSPNPVKKPGKSSTPQAASPLSQKYTLTVKNAPLLEVLKTFEAKGIQFDYDREQLESAKISLDRKVNIDVTTTTAEKILRDLLEPLGLEFTIDGDKVRLQPKD